MRILGIFSGAFGLSILLINYIAAGEIWVALFFLCIGVFAGSCIFGKENRRKPLAAMLICGGAAAGLLWMQWYAVIYFLPAKNLDDHTIQMNAEVMDYPRETEYGFSVLVKVKSENKTIKALLYTDKQGESLQPGDQIATIAHCTAANRSSRGEEITYYTAKGIFLWAQAYGKLEIDRPENKPLSCVPAVLALKLKQNIACAYEPDDAAMVQAVVTGNREGLTDQFTTSLQRTGLSHVVAVSGMHLSCFCGVLILFLGRGKRVTAIVVICWSILFCTVAGNTPSVSRAAIMVILLQIAPLFYRQNDGLTSMGTALMLLLLWNPFSVTHVGLQLSFASVAGILLISEPMQEKLYCYFHLDEREDTVWKRLIFSAGRWGISTICATFGAMVFTVALSVLYFGSVSLVAPISNMLILWAVSLLFAGGLLSGFAGIWFPEVAVWMAKPVSCLIWYIRYITESLSGFSFSAIPIDSFYYRIWLIFLYVVLVIVWFAGRNRRFILPVCCVCVTLLCAVWYTSMEFRSGSGKIVVLDVGQGQSVLIRSGQSLVMADCGGSKGENAGNIAADYLQSRGYRHLDFLILTHDHTDHANGVCQLLERIDVKMLVLPQLQEENQLRREILRKAEEKGTEIRLLKEDIKLLLEDGNSVTMYAPMEVNADVNEQGLTVLAEIGDFSALLTGDMGENGERALLHHRQLSEVELLVAGHHGGSASSGEEFLNVIKPKLAVISVGEQNRYGHPGEDTLRRLEKIGAEIYRTDLHSTVVINID